MRCQRGCGVLDVGEVGRTIAQRRRDGDHGDFEAGAVVSARGRQVPPATQSAVELYLGDVLDLGLTGREALDPLLVDVESDHAVADLDRAHREWQTDVALSHHEDTPAL